MTSAQQHPTSEGLPAYKAAQKAPRVTEGANEVMRAAFMLQVEQNTEDATWLTKLDVAPEVLSQIRVRLAQRGGVWLDFLSTCLNYQGDFVEFSQDLRKSRESLPH